jgi:rubredoxin-NAD+ reductase
MKALIIIGSGLAGYTLAREWRKRESTRPLTIITRDHGGFYSKPMLSNAFAQNKTPEQLVLKTAEQMAEELDATILNHTEVGMIDPAGKTLTAGDERFEYADLVIASGASPIHIPVEGNAAKDILSVNNLDDYQRFRNQLAGVQHVVLMGAGLIGCEFANDLTTGGFKVTVLDPAPWPLGRLLPEQAGQAIRAALIGIGVDVRMGTTLEKMDHAERAYDLTLSDSTTLQADLVLSAVGLRPDLSLAEQAQLETRRGIVTDSQLRTSDPHIYALGDVAEIDGQVLPFVMPIMHGARALAATLSGEPTDLSYPVMPVAVKTPALPTVVSPPPRDAEGEWKIEADGNDILARFESASGGLLGFALTGEASASKQSLVAEMSAG